MGFIDQDLSAFIPEIWSKKLQKIFDNITVMKPLCNTDYQGDIAQAGDTVHVQLPGNLTMNDYVRNQPMTLQQATATDDTLLINQQKQFYFGVDDLDQAQSNIKLMAVYADRAATATRNTIDTHLLSHYADALLANTIGSTTTPISLNANNIYSYFTTMAELLDLQNIPEQDRNAVVPPQIRTLIINSPEMRDRSTPMVDETIQNGKVGIYGRWNVHVTTNMAQVSGTYPLMFFTPDFIAYASQVAKTEKERPTGYMIDAVKGLYLYGSKVFSGLSKAGGTLYASA